MTRLLAVEIPEYAGRDLSVESTILGPGFDIRRFTWSGDEQALIDACDGADCILSDFVPFTSNVIANLSTCKLISIAATGFGCVDVAAAARANISVCAIDEYCTSEVADHAMMLILALARKLKVYDRQVQDQHIWRFDKTDGLVRLTSKTLGLIGFGRIGQAVARRATSFGLRVIAHDPCFRKRGDSLGDNPADAHSNTQIADDIDVALCDLETIFAESDIISLHCAATADNHAMINSDAFSAMRKTPILINVARGSLIDERALVNALDTGQISAAGLDVLASESPDLAASKLLKRDNVILTPHAAFYSDAAIMDSRTISAANIRHWFDGEHQKVRKYIYHSQ